MRKNLLFVLLTLSCLSAIADNLNDYNIRSFGAVGDGKNLDSPAINTAIESAFANGGGKIIVPAGIYLCGSIHLKSNIELHLLPGAIIKAAPASMKVYDESESFGGFPEYQDGGHTYFHNSLIWAEGQENILIRDITIFRGGHFAIIITGCEKGTIDNVTIDTNRDGIDIDCCKYLTVTNTKVNTPNDDGIVLKSSYALKKPVPCENILINNCIVTGYKLGTFLDGTYIPEKVNWVCGRIKLGTESNGGYRNIAISNCTMMYSSGLAFEEVDQGRMENIAVSNITMNHVHHYPIYITTGCRNRGPKEVTSPSYGGDIMISNVIADDADSLAGIIVTGMKEEPLRNIRLHNIQIRYRGGGTSDLSKKEYREQGTNYPEPRWAGPTPAYGLYARHVDGLTVRGLYLETIRPDYRHVVILDDVKNADIQDLTAPVQKGAEKIVIKN